MANIYEKYCIKYLEEQNNLDYICKNLIPSIKYPTEEIFLKIMEKVGIDALNYISKNLDENIAVKYLTQYPSLIKFIKNQTKEMCKFVMAQNIMLFKYIKCKTQEMCEAVNRNYTLLKYINDQTEEVCKLAILNNPNALMYIKNPTLKMLKYALNLLPYSVKLNNLAIKISYEIYKYLLDLKNIDFNDWYYTTYTNDVWENLPWKILTGTKQS